MTFNFPHVIDCYFYFITTENTNKLIKLSKLLKFAIIKGLKLFPSRGTPRPFLLYPVK
jgi:hypothetical protein